MTKVLNRFSMLACKWSFSEGGRVYLTCLQPLRLMANPFDLQLECASLVIRVGGQTLQLIDIGARSEIKDSL
jgi:hypothetical protein